MTERPNPAEIIARRDRDRQAVASLLIEGMKPTPEEDALFAEFDRLGLCDEECRRRLLERAAARASGAFVRAE